MVLIYLSLGAQVLPLCSASPKWGREGIAFLVFVVTWKQWPRLLSPQAVDSRDSLAMALYARCFEWVIKKINSRIKGKDDFKSIGILDIFGFENFEVCFWGGRHMNSIHLLADIKQISWNKHWYFFLQLFLPFLPLYNTIIICMYYICNSERYLLNGFPP